MIPSDKQRKPLATMPLLKHNALPWSRQLPPDDGRDDPAVDGDESEDTQTT